MLNFYEHRKIKPLLDTIKSPTESETGFHYGAHTLIVGGTGTGKSNYLMNFILRSPNTFQHIVICNRGIKEPLYEALEKQLGKQGKLTFFTLETLPDVNTLSSKREDQEKDKWLIIFDDVVADLADRKMEKKINQYVTTGRKLGFTSFYLSQSFFAFPKMVRKNITHLVLLKLSGARDLKLILSDFASIGLTKEQLCDIHRKATEERMNCLKIDIHNTDPNKKFTRNFTDPFYVREVVDEKSGETTAIVEPGSWYKPLKANDHLIGKKRSLVCDDDLSESSSEREDDDDE